MRYRKLQQQLLGVTVVMLFLVGSSAPSVITVPEAPKVPSTPLPATLLPTETATPTLLPTDTPQPVATLDPEQPATSVQHIIGQWAIRLMGGGEGDPAVLAFKPDGTYSIDCVGGYHEGMNIDTGMFLFESGLLKLDSNSCYAASGKFFHCGATYQAFVAMGESAPGMLRLAALEDEYPDRKKSFDGKKFLPVPAQ
jgi:hypothetical protein